MPPHSPEEVRCDGESRFGPNDGVYSAPRADCGLDIINPFHDLSRCKGGQAVETSTEAALQDFFTMVVAVAVSSHDGKMARGPVSTRIETTLSASSSRRI